MRPKSIHILNEDGKEGEVFGFLEYYEDMAKGEDFDKDDSDSESDEGSGMWMQ